MTKSQAPTPELLALHRRYGQSRCLKLRNRLVEAHLNLVRQQAARFSQASSACYNPWQIEPNIDDVVNSLNNAVKNK